ncbi:hypothetical protein PFUGPA_05324 [Plasmodium falciparum Palo Alto/Uganda]|uniref:EF-hand domain-containing protein n=3 Tax=Plasmodium falciparum TaxID=5833 RepID=W4IUJ4_PLAFP|nr:hypothetical protein PFUGPA_05324 [Plasmodium falciparum Palo Alto/Uganda]ETW60742.1 hypothetical protein PFMC_03442 [Plasmodium falciparum CAMP/Malaysia]KOB61233.1 hypothetical protein PFHG_02985 [Plasmodium falciparum HB3]
MATRKKERYHTTGKGNKIDFYLNLDEFENIKSITNNNEKKNDEKFSSSTYKSYSDNDNNGVSLYSKKNMLFNEDNINVGRNNYNKTSEKHEERSNNRPMIQLNKIMSEEDNTYYKGTCCKFNDNKGKKKIDKDKDNHNIYNKKNDVVKEYNLDELWTYLNHVHNAEDSRLKYKINEIMERKNSLNNHNNNNKEEDNDYTEKINNVNTTYNMNNKKRNHINKKNNDISYKNNFNDKNYFNYEEYKYMVKYILPSIDDKKLKYSWSILKENIQPQNEQLNHKDIFKFINEKTGNEESNYVNKIVCSKLKNKMLKYNFNPSDVQLKTINYIDTIRSRACEFSKHFKDLITDNELTELFKEKEKIKKDDLEKEIVHIINERLKDENMVYVQKKEETNKNKHKNDDNMLLSISVYNNMKRKKEGLTDFNIKAYISTLLTNKNDEVYVKDFINNLQVDYDLISNENINVKDAYDFYSRNIPPTENINNINNNMDELNKDEIERAKFLIEEIDYSVRNNFKSHYINTNNNHKNIKLKILNDNEKSYLSLYEIFKHLDNDKDSYITKDDLIKSVNKLKLKNITNNDINILMKYMDNEKKGYINVNDFLKNYEMEEKSMLNWIKNTNKPYFDFVSNLKNKSHERSISEKIKYNKNASIAKKYNDVINNYNLELDPHCPSYVIRERIRENFIAKKEDFINKHKKASRFHLTNYKNTNNLIEPLTNSDLYMNDKLRFKTTYNMNYN